MVQRTPDSFSDLEDLQKTVDDYWFVAMAIEQLHRLPSELEDIGMREVCTLRAYGIVKAAYEGELRFHLSKTNNGTAPIDYDPRTLGGD